MSHSKYTKRGYSLYIENWNRSAKKYINTCVICGHQGYSPVIERNDFCDSWKNKLIYKELSIPLWMAKPWKWGAALLDFKN